MRNSSKQGHLATHPKLPLTERYGAVLTVIDFKNSFFNLAIKGKGGPSSNPMNNICILHIV